MSQTEGQGGEEARRTHGQVHAPFTPEQVESLNAYQHSGTFHEFTCGDDAHHPEGEPKPRLVAFEGGWYCETEGCPYVQYWAWRWMADGSWREMKESKLAGVAAESKGHRGVVCTKLKVKATEGTKVTDAEIVSIALGCKTNHRPQRDVGAGSTIFLHGEPWAFLVPPE